MTKPFDAILYLDTRRFRAALQAGIHKVVSHKDYINKINVFPVPDSDTGSNLVFTFKTILDDLHGFKSDRLAEFVDLVADSALDGARGNSGAIMAQYLEGFRQGAKIDNNRLLAAGLARAVNQGAVLAWGALAEPVEGTMPTVLQDFGQAVTDRVAAGIQDIREIFRSGLERARQSLANTPNQLPVLKSAGVVDAGGQGFVDLLEGIWAYIQTGDLVAAMDITDETVDQPLEMHAVEDVGEHQFCTECMVIGKDIDRDRLRVELTGMDSSSLVIAGSRDRLRVHIHVNNPAQVFLHCEQYGEVTRQKADDLLRQQAMLHNLNKVVVVTDSAADVPEDEMERLNIHMVPVRLMFGDQDYLDKVSITPAEFYTRLESAAEFPKTSQPPAGDFVRQFEQLVSHGHDVVSINVSRKLSGTLQAAEYAAGRFPDGRVRIVDSFNGAAGQGLVALFAGEAAAAGLTADEVKLVSDAMVSRTHSYAFVQDMSWGVRGGRIPAWLEKFSRLILVNPVLANTAEGKLSIRGVVFGRRHRVPRFARLVARKMRTGQIYRIIIGHSNAADAAREVRQVLLQSHPQVHSCMITDTGPAVGAHLGPGGLVAGIQAWQQPNQLLAEIKQQ